MNITVGGWILYSIIALFIIASAGMLVISLDFKKGAGIGIAFAALVACVLVLIGFNWFYSSTAAGLRAKKSQDSNFQRGIERRVEVYDMNGQLIKEYEGRFDVAYDNDRIIFDDENGQRHIIFYPTGTVIIDEIGGNE